MENRIPIPTDNLYKFYALFGLLLAVFSIASTIYVNKTTNELVFASWVDVEQLKQIEKPTPIEAAKLKALERRLEVAQSDKTFFQRALAWLFGIAFWLAVFGFWKWHRYLQPMQDELLTLQLKALRRGLKPSWKRQR